MQWRITRAQPGNLGRRAGVAGLVAAGLVGGGLLALNFAPMRGGASLGSARDYAVRIVLPRAHEAPRVDEGAVSAATPVALAEPSVEASPAPPAAALATVARRPRGPNLAGVIALDYNLSGGAQAGDAIELDKPVSVGGADAGRIALRIDGNARVYAQGRRVAALLVRHGGAGAVPEGLGDDFVSLEALRAMGIDVRYDAARDRLLLAAPGA